MNYQDQNKVQEWQTRLDYLKNTQETVPGQLARGYYSLAEEMFNAGVIGQAAFDKAKISGEGLDVILKLLTGSTDLVSSKLATMGTNIAGVGQALNMFSLIINTTTQGGKALSGVL